jgi:hypothetical protein
MGYEIRVKPDEVADVHSIPEAFRFWAVRQKLVDDETTFLQIRQKGADNLAQTLAHFPALDGKVSLHPSLEGGRASNNVPSFFLVLRPPFVPGVLYQTQYRLPFLPLLQTTWQTLVTEIGNNLRLSPSSSPMRVWPSPVAPL